MALTQKEINRNLYIRRKESGLCPQCGKPLDRNGHYCKECLEKSNTYNRETRKWCKEHHICTKCRKEKVLGNERICPECLAEIYIKKKPLTDEQKKRYGERFKKQQRSLYQERKEKGICTKCGKLKAAPGKAKCAICLEKDAEVHRRCRLYKN